MFLRLSNIKAKCYSGITRLTYENIAHTLISGSYSKRWCGKDGKTHPAAWTFQKHHFKAHPGFAASARPRVGHFKVQMVNAKVCWHGTVSAMTLPSLCGHRKYVNEWMWLGANKALPASHCLLSSAVVNDGLPKALGHSIPSHSLKTGPCPFHVSVSSKSYLQQ